MPNNFPTQQDYFYPKKYCLTKNNKKSQQKLQNIQINWNKRKQHKSMEPKISKNNAKHWKKWLNCREMLGKLLQKKRNAKICEENASKSKHNLLNLFFVVDSNWLWEFRDVTRLLLSCSIIYRERQRRYLYVSFYIDFLEAHKYNTKMPGMQIFLNSWH